MLVLDAYFLLAARVIFDTDTMIPALHAYWNTSGYLTNVIGLKVGDLTSQSLAVPTDFSLSADRATRTQVVWWPRWLCMSS